MKDLGTMVRNSLYFGIGAISLTRERVEELVGDLIKKGEMSSKEGKRFSEEVTDSIDRARKEIDERVRRRTRKAAEALNLVTRDELVKIDRKVSRLRSDLRKLSKEIAEGKGH
jgi:polyhydroxyalkanoate synthesis regulator phasin